MTVFATCFPSDRHKAEEKRQLGSRGNRHILAEASGYVCDKILNYVVVAQNTALKPLIDFVWDAWYADVNTFASLKGSSGGGSSRS